MERLRVSAEGLRELAGRCEALADNLTSGAAPATTESPSGQASALAVGACDARMAAAGAALAVWTRAAAAKTTAAASAYENQDTELGAELDTKMV
jgi:Excreted virulence factor EspC, type VII ESX diderm